MRHKVRPLRKWAVSFIWLLRYGLYLGNTVHYWPHHSQIQLSSFTQCICTAWNIAKIPLPSKFFQRYCVCVYKTGTVLQRTPSHNQSFYWLCALTINMFVPAWFLFLFNLCVSTSGVLMSCCCCMRPPTHPPPSPFLYTSAPPDGQNEMSLLPLPLLDIRCRWQQRSVTHPDRFWLLMLTCCVVVVVVVLLVLDALPLY